MKPILGYFKLRGWAGPIRLLLAYLEVDYEEIFYKLPVQEPNDDNKCQNNNSTCEEKEWAKEKSRLGLQFPNLPYWIENNVKLTETKAILKHIARTRSPLLLGQTTNEKAQVNMLEEIFWDMWNSLCQICLKNEVGVMEHFLEVTESKLQLIARSCTGMWAVGSNITLADFLLYEILHSYKTFQNTLLLPFPELEAFMTRFENIPEISKYISSQQFIKGPCFSAKFKSRL